MKANKAISSDTLKLDKKAHEKNEKKNQRNKGFRKRKKRLLNFSSS